MTRDRTHGDGGYALIVVMGFMMVLTLLVMTAVSAATGGIRTSGDDQAYQAAQDAAQAGVQDYLNRLNLDAAYYRFGNSPPVANPAFTGFVDVPSASTAAGPPPGRRPQFRYRLLAADPAAEVAATGTISLEATGKVGPKSRTVRVKIGRKSFLDYLFFTVYETTPPIAAVPADTTFDPTRCEAFAGARPAQCDLLVYVDSDDFNGPVHSKDRLVIFGSPTFREPVTTEWTGEASGRLWHDYGSSRGKTTNPSFPAGFPARQVVEFPSSNDKLANQALAGNGCVYTGPTRVLFNGNGTMTVSSPYSSALPMSAACGTFRSANSYTATVPVPTNGVIHVRGAAPGCNAAWQSSFVRFPIPGDDALSSSSKLGYSCTQGDAFVEGQVKGRVTVHAANNVVVTGNLTYDGGLGGSDILGLTADSVVAVYHPVTCTAQRNSRNQCTAGSNVSRAASPRSTTAASVVTAYPMQDVQIDAVILAGQNGFLVQNEYLGAPLGKVIVRGAIAQRFRGGIGRISGSVSNGYTTKDYSYDKRAAFAPPPYMADLTASAWEVRQFAERSG